MRTLDFASQIVVISCAVEQVSISGMLAVWFERSSLAHLVSLPMVLWEQVCICDAVCRVVREIIPGTTRITATAQEMTAMRLAKSNF